jgi:electron transport complex protein RnfD
MSLRFNAQGAPHIRHGESTRAITLDAVIALLFLYAIALYYYGPRAVLLGVFGLAAAVAVDVLCLFFAGKPVNTRDLSPVVTGLLLPLMMPATIPFHVVGVAVVFALAVAKHPFGGMGHNVFNPAAAGFSFAAICFTDKMFLYPLPRQALPVTIPAEQVLTNSPAYTLLLGGVPKLETADMLLGNFPGPMGATNILVILACLLYLILRGTVRWEMPVSFLCSAAAFAWLFPRAEMAGVDSLQFEMMSGMLLLGGVFLLGDPVTTPKRGWTKAVYGVFCGVIVMLFRVFGNLEEELTFAILLMNATVWGFDMLGEYAVSAVRRRRYEIRGD